MCMIPIILLTNVEQINIACSIYMYICFSYYSKTWALHLIYITLFSLDEA